MEHRTFRRVIELLMIGAALALAVVYFPKVVEAFSAFAGLLKPLLLGVVIAYLVDIPAKKLELKFQKRIKKPIVARALATCISLLLFLLFIAGVLVLLLPQLGVAIKQFGTNLPVLYQESVESLQQLMSRRPELEQGFTLLETYVNAGIEQVKASSPKIADYTISLLGGAVSSVATGLIALIFSLYLLFGKHRLVSQLSYLAKRFSPEQHYHKITAILIVANRTFSKFFTGQFLEAVILGTLCTLGMLLFRFPYALTVGSVVGMTALIPLVGAYLGGAVGFVLIFGQSLRLALFFVLFLVILQQLEGNIIYPRVVGSSVGLPGVWVFVSVILGAGLFGIPGVLFGVPLAATVYQLLKQSKQ
ncbi:MAG: AI-2E family transporter [Sphaerochaeta sp.]|nr:AI-2E family transporter [Sphaerochaeta sp.]